MATLAGAERSGLETSDAFTPHALPAAELAESVAMLDAEPDIRMASLVRKTVVHRPRLPCFVLFLNTANHERKLPGDNTVQNLMMQLVKQIKLPGSTHIFVANESNQAVGKTILAVPGSTIYHRNP